MKKTYLIALAITGALSNPFLSSTVIANAADEQKLYEKAITVLSNKDSILPFHFRDSIKIASIVVGDKKMNAFQKQLLNYYPVDMFAIEQNASADVYRSMSKNFINYDMIILSLHNTTMKAEKNFGLRICMKLQLVIQLMDEVKPL